jgi:DNA polymerase-3 subunit delta
MPLRIDQLAGHLQRGPLSHCYVVSGDEALLCLEAQDAIRTAARAQGFEERTVIHADARMDWSALDEAASGLSLFASKRLLEIRLPTGKPGKSGAQALQTHARRRDDGTLTILSLPKLDWSTRKAEWVQTLEASTTWIDVPMIGRDRLPEWIAGRLARQKQRATREALEFLADRVEGNLLAANQEIGKLHLLYGEGELTLDQIRAATLDVARFDPAALPGAMLQGDRLRVARLISGLRAEGEPLPLILWLVTDELRTLLRLRQGIADGKPAAQVLRGARLNASPALVERMMPRLEPVRLASMLARCAELDRLAKGLSVAGRDADPWLELTEVVLSLHSGANGPVRS